MKANEFVKKYGLEYAKHILNEDSVILVDLDYTHIKRLVESHELVESYGGISFARKEAHKNCFKFNAPLLKAIYDVESCQ